MYSFTSTVRYSECDEHGILSIVALVNYLQDCSTFQCEELGLGLDHMRDNKIAWLLAAWQIEIERMPRFGEPITVSTWCYDMKRSLASRNFCIKTAEGETLVRADSLWFVFDREKQRPVRIPDSELAFKTDEPRLDMPDTRRKLTCEGAWEEGKQIVVSEQQLDTNRHVNNAQYVLMAQQASRGDVAWRRICVQYCQQARLGDVICPRIYLDGTRQTVALCDTEGEPYAIVSLEA